MSIEFIEIRNGESSMQAGMKMQVGETDREVSESRKRVNLVACFREGHVGLREHLEESHFNTV